MAKKYHLRPELRSSMQNSNTRMRTGCNDILVVIGGFGIQQMPVDTVEKYDPKTQEWESLPVRVLIYSGPTYNIDVVHWFYNIVVL